MPLDLNSIPLADLQVLLDIVTKKTPLSLSALSSLGNIIGWAIKAFSHEQLQPIGAGGESPSDEEALLSLIGGTAVPDGAAGGGILLSLAASVALKLAAKLLAELLS